MSVSSYRKYTTLPPRISMLPHYRLGISSIYCKMFLPLQLGICLLGALGVRGVTRQVAGT